MTVGWVEPTGRANARPMINSAKPITTLTPRDGYRFAQPIRRSRCRGLNMNFDDTPQEAAFRGQAKAWIAANAPKQYEEELKKSSLGRPIGSFQAVKHM